MSQKTRLNSLLFFCLISFTICCGQTTNNASNPPSLGEVFQPKLSIGAGMMSFHGDLYSKHFQAPWTGRVGYHLDLSQRLTTFLQLDFNILFGKLGANEFLNNRQTNFQSEIRSGGLSLLYDFGNFIPKTYKVRPWLSAGVSSIEFLSKTDLFDKNGDRYYYWSDGSIKDIDENSVYAPSAKSLVRDYVYESDIRELNLDGFGKYREQAWAIPVGVGALMKVTEHFDFKIGMTYYFTSTDYIDGVTNKSVGARAGTKQKDRFVYTSFAIQYDLSFKSEDKNDTLPAGYFDDVDWLAVNQSDSDADGVMDTIDKCLGTALNVKVDGSGCPLDDDKDGVPNTIDEEPNTTAGLDVDSKGVHLDENYWANWYGVHIDSISLNKRLEIIGSSLDSMIAKRKTTERQYAVELGRYKNGVPDKDMSYLLSIGDVKSYTLEDGTTVVYTTGTSVDILKAIKRRDELIKSGNKNAKVNYFKNNQLFDLNNVELEELVATAQNNTANASNTTTTSKNEIEVEENFSPNEIVYRVQLGAYKNPISKSTFKNAGKVVELKGEGDFYKYATIGFKTIKQAAEKRADLLVDGYKDAFITAYQYGKRIPLNTTAAKVENTKEVESLNDVEKFNAFDKSLIEFKIQLGALRKPGNNDLESRLKGIDGVNRQTTNGGMYRYTMGSFQNYESAEKYRQELLKKGFTESFVIAMFKGEIISVVEGKELSK